MAKPPPTITLHFPSAQMPAIITRLTTYLLQKHYTFMQARDDATSAGFEIFNPQDQPIIRLTLQAVDTPGAPSGQPAAEMLRSLNADAARLLQHLLRTE